MTDRSGRETEYVLIRDSKPKKTTRYYYDADDDNDSQNGVTTTRRILRTKPTKEQRVKYVTADELDSDYRRPRVTESNDRGLKVRHTTNGERVILDEDNNVLKIIRNSRSPSPPYTENRRIKLRQREPRTLYYETSDGHLIARQPMNHISPKKNQEFVYAEDEPTKLVRRVVIDPRTGDQETIYENNKPKKPIQQKYVIHKRTNIPTDSDNDYDQQQQQQQQQYVQVVQRRTVPKQETTPTTKYVMIRKKVDSEPVYALESSIPTIKNNRRIVYESPTKKTPITYVYSTNGKYYK